MPTFFAKMKNHARNELSNGDVKHIGAWSKISHLAQQQLRASNEKTEVEIDDWMKILHHINAQYYHDVADAMHVFLIEVKTEEASGNKMT
jgi:hypothetical protein